MRSMTVRHRTFSDQPGRGRAYSAEAAASAAKAGRRRRLPLASIPLALLMLGLLSMSAQAEDGVDSRQDKAADKAAKTAESPKMGGHTFSSDLRLDVFILREAGGEWERIGKTPSAGPLDIPRCVSWGVFPIGQVDMKALARQIAAKKIPHLRIDYAVDSDLAHLKNLTGLRELDFTWPRITDAGLTHLKGLTGLRKLNLRRTQITDAGLADLKKALPKTDIDR